MATATAGGGAFIEGRRLRVRTPQDGLRHLDVVVPQSKWWTPEQRARFNALSHAPVALSYLDTSGLEYVELAAGRRGAMVLSWENPWDHAAGLLLHAEAGGVTTTRDGSPFRLTGGNALPFVAAPDAATTDALHRALSLPGEAGPV
jgi:fructose-1,6-bisphosphatase/inositol monophosphatase family enzyme